MCVWLFYPYLVSYILFYALFKGLTTMQVRFQIKDQVSRSTASGGTAYCDEWGSPKASH